MGNTHEFHFEIHSLSAFAAFVAILRGDDLDDATLRALTVRLTQATTALSEAEKAAAVMLPEKKT
jgi:hypothetical protein